MRLLHALLAIGCAATSLHAQDSTLSVLRRTPGDTASPGNLVTVTFDRPVAGHLDETVEAVRIFRVEPAIAGRVAWRDPITIRFVPDEPLRPGTEYTVTVDTAFRALDGTRLERPYRYSFRAPGPRLLARSYGGDDSGTPVVLPFDGKVKLLYSAPIDTAWLERGVHLDLPGCGDGRREFALRVVRQRTLAKDDPRRFSYAGGWDRDTLADRFHRVVELEPVTPLPEECAGQLVLPTTADDEPHGREERFAVRTAPRFRLASFHCGGVARCSMDNLTLVFTAGVTREDVQRHVRMTPEVPLADMVPRMVAAPDEPADGAPRSKQWAIELRLRPRTTYTVVVDEALRDAHGRALHGSRRAQLITGDLEPTVGFAIGLQTAPRGSARTIPLRHVNVRTVRMLSYRIPESKRAQVLSVQPWLLGRELATLARGPDTTVFTLPDALNLEAITELPLPASLVGGDGTIVALRIELASAITPPTAGSDSVPRGQMLPPVHVVATAPEQSYALVQLTDLAVHAKMGAGEGAVLITGLEDGRPRPGATVRHLDHAGALIAQATTDSSGVASFRPAERPNDGSSARGPIRSDWPPQAGLIEATLGDDRVVTPLGVRAIGYQPSNPLDPWRVGARLGRVPPVAATIFAERGIYRPGEMLYLKGIVREGILGALTAPASRPVRLTLTRSASRWSDDDVVVHDTVLTTTEFGTVADSLRLRPGLALGDYKAELHVGGPDDWRSVASESVRLAEYRAPEFLVETLADSTPRFGGDTAHVDAVARYLFGAPMARAAVRWGAELREVQPWELRIPGAEGWTVGELDWQSRDDQAEARSRLAGDDSLDAGGRLGIRVPITELRSSRPGRLEVSVAVTDVNRQVVSSSVGVPVHPARLYVLARRQSRTWYWTVGQPATVEIRTVRPDGAEHPGVPVIVTVVRRDPRWDGSYGRWADTIVGTDTVRTGARPLSYSFSPATGGYYDLRLSAADGHGGIARTTLSGYAMASGGGWGANSPYPYHLPLVVGTREVAVGDEAQVAFDSPFDAAEAWVTVERERVLERWRVPVRRGTNVVPVRITEAHAPNVFVSVLLLRRGEKAARPDSGSQRMRVGYTELRVGTAPKRLTVTVAPRAAEYHPGDSAVVDVHVGDVAGRGTRSEVTLWAVDQGVLALTDFRTPDVLARMYEPRALGAGLWSTLPTLLRRDPGIIFWLGQTASGVSFLSVFVTGIAEDGADASMTAMRSQFRSAAFYLAAATTDDQGRAELTARLPDNLTTYRVMAVAVGADDRFGHGDTTMLVTRPLVARPSLPRFVRAGDSLVAGAVVNARDGRARPVVVEAASDGIAVQGEARRELMLADGKGAEARFAFGMPARDSAPDSVVVRVRASDGTHGDAVETRLPVRPDFHRRVHTRMGTVRDETDVVLELPADIDAARSQLTLRVGTSPLAPMLAAYEWLRVYPYQCTEQIASGGRALIAVWRAMRNRDPVAPGGDPRPRLQQLADELARRQRPDGAFRFWNDYEWTSPWLTAYAGHFLLEARDEGIVVDSLVLRQAARYLAAELESPIDTGGMNRDERRSRRLALGGRIAAVDYLRRFGMPEEKAEDQLLRIARGMTWEDRLRLAEVLAPRPERSDDARALVDAAWRAVTPAGRRVDLPDSARAERAFPSRVAPASRLLTASLALRPDHPMLGGLIETVLQHGRAEGRWAWSTQDYASVVMAMAALTDDAGPAREVRVRAGGRVVLSQRAGITDSTAVPLTGLLERARNGRTRLRLRLGTARGAKPLYFAVSVDEVPSTPPVTPDFQGIVVERWYERFDDGRPVTSVKEGDLVRVRLRVTVPADRQFVAIEDPLPAGLEPVDLSLRTSATLQPFVTPESEQARLDGDRDRDGPRWQSWLYGRWDDGWWSPWDHKALHDDKVVYFARMLWTGSYTASYVARATTTGTFVRPPAHAEEMYNPALRGRSDGGRFGVDEGRP